MDDLNLMSLADLKSLQKNVTKAIDTFEKRRKSDAVVTLEAAAKKHGFTLAELMESATAQKRTTTVPKYANPTDVSDTWSGRGRRPRWFTEAIESGVSADDLLI